MSIKLDEILPPADKLFSRDELETIFKGAMILNGPEVHDLGKHPLNIEHIQFLRAFCWEYPGDSEWTVAMKAAVMERLDAMEDAWIQPKTNTTKE